MPVVHAHGVGIDRVRFPAARHFLINLFNFGGFLVFVYNI